MESKDFLEFGPFRANVRERVLLREGQLIPLPGKAFDTLLALLQRPGETVSKDELMKTVWPDTFVEEGNLTQTIFVLRKALGDADGQSLVITMPRQGYRFAGEVKGLPAQAIVKGAIPPEQGASPPRRIPWSWLVAGVLAVLGAAGWWNSFRSIKRAQDSIMSLSVDLGPDAIWSNGRTVTMSPDGTRIVFQIRMADGKTALAVRSLDQISSRSTTTPLPGTVGATDAFFSPDGQWIAYVAASKLKKTPVQGGVSTTICDAPEFGGGSWGGKNQIIAVLGSASGLFRIGAGGEAPELLAKPSDHQEVRWLWPQILPGGEAVIYTANAAVNNFDDASIEVLSLKTKQWKTLQRGAYYSRYLPSGHLVWARNQTLFGARFDPVRLEMSSAPVRLVDEDLASNPDLGAGEFDFSDTGTFVYLSGAIERSVVRIDSEGKAQPLITTPARYRDPSLSPEGKLLAIATGLGQSEIQILDLERKTLSQRTFLKGCRIPAWTSDGRHILFACTGAKDGTVWWTRADGTGEPMALFQAPGSVERFSLSPDGGTLFVLTRGNEMLRVPLDKTDPDRPKAGKQQLFLRMTQHGSTLAISPDGRWIAYSNPNERESGIYVQPTAPGSHGKWQVSPGPARHPTWSRSAQQLLYQDSEGHVLVVDYTVKGDTFSAGKARLWVERQFALGIAAFPARIFDLEPDGKHIVTIVDPVNDQGNHLHVTFLVNFFDAIKRRLPR